jgi:hypothetical protein
VSVEEILERIDRIRRYIDDTHRYAPGGEYGLESGPAGAQIRVWYRELEALHEELDKQQ